MRPAPAMNSEELNIQFLEVKDAAYRYAASLLHDSAEAEDMVQDLYEKLWRRRLFIRYAGFRSLVMTSLRNMCLDSLRRRQRDRHAEIRECHITVEMAEGDNLTMHIGRIIAQLPEREQEVIHLHDVEGMDYDDIAEIMSISTAAARMACSRARQKVKEQLIKIM